MKTIDRFPSIRTTGIGSLPHHNVDAALEYTFRWGIPFLPQIPIRNPGEYMIAQALEGLEGLKVGNQGSVLLDIELWKSRTHLLDKKLNTVFRATQVPDAFADFEPSSTSSSCWQPFLWELQERNIPIAKVQIAGPMTTQWALRIQGELTVAHSPDLSKQIFQLVLARSLGMVQRMQTVGVHPLLYLDEPGLYALSPHDPQHVLRIQELKLMIQTLQKAGATVGLHCCSRANWAMICSLNLDILSLDVTCLQDSLTTDPRPIFGFIQNGGLLSIGVIPTAHSTSLADWEPRAWAEQFKKDLHPTFRLQPDLLSLLLQKSIYTPACGLALQSTSNVETILEKV